MSSADASPINIPSTHQRGGGITNSLSNFATSLADAIQPWTGNYSYTASTYMRDNITLPAENRDNLGQSGTFGQVSYRPGRFNQHLGLGSSSLPSNQSFHTAYSSPHNFPSNYGSIATNSYNPISLTEDGSPLGASFINNHHSALWRNSAAEDQNKLSQKKIPEHTPLVKPNSNHSFVPLSKVTEIEIPERIGSNFRQSIFNSCNVLIGIGILALPLGFKYAGWVFGFSIFFFCLLVTNYTAKIIKKCMDYDEGLYTYADIGAAAFGQKSRIFISILFCLELFASGVALVILVGDSLNTIFPSVPLVFLKVIAWAVMTPLTLIAIRYLSYFSLLGIISSVCLVNVLIIDGYTKQEGPGSLINPKDTDLFPFQWYNLPMSFGLIMAGFTGHAVFPSVYRDMQNPKQYPKMVNYSYIITTVMYLLMAACGYLMFGRDVMQEITQNIMSVESGYNRTLNRVMIWLVAIYPIPKYALMTNPINLTFEMYYKSIPRLENWCNNGGKRRRNLLKVISRVLLSTNILIVALLIPEFERIMGILGSFFSYFISAIFPCIIHLKLFGTRLSLKEKSLNVFIIITCGIMSTLGTIWAFLPATGPTHLDD